MSATQTERMRWPQRADAPFLIVGATAIVTGGLLSALTARSATYHSAWAVAYLVLVVGVAQLVLISGQTLLAGVELSGGVKSAEFLLFNLGNAGVMVGALTALPLIVDAGTVLLIFGLAAFLLGVRGARSHRGWVLAYRAVVILLMLSALLGVYFAHNAP